MQYGFALYFALWEGQARGLSVRGNEAETKPGRKNVKLRFFSRFSSKSNEKGPKRPKNIKFQQISCFPHFCRNFAFSDIRRQSRKSPATPPQLILHTSRIFRKSPATPPQLKMVENGENRPNSAQKGQMGQISYFSSFSSKFYTFPSFFVQNLHFSHFPHF